MLVDRAVGTILDLAVLARRNVGLSATLKQPLAQFLAVVSLIGDEFDRCRHRRNAELRDLAIVNVSGRQEQDAGPPPLVTDRMELGFSSAFRAADTMSQAPFPPPAQR